MVTQYFLFCDFFPYMTSFTLQLSLILFSIHYHYKVFSVLSIFSDLSNNEISFINETVFQHLPALREM